jgi:hypothetical protein
LLRISSECFFISLHPTKRYYYYEDKEPLPYALCFSPARQHGGHAKEVKIGMAIDDLRLERWQKDRDIFVNKAESLGAKFCPVSQWQRRNANVANRKYDQPRRRCSGHYSL